jgi:WD40 repeat protein/tetratricopeptide (TPR) repeat protein
MSLRNPNLGGDFFVAGGTLAPGHASYVERKADTDLFNAICAGEFCYVLTSRQMGKSSLFSRVAGRLRGDGFRVSIVDLQSIGINVSIEQWFDGMLERIGSDFDLEDEIDDFRDDNPELGALQTWLEVIRRVLLVRIPGRVVIVIDEIDLVRSIQGFSTDDLFLGIRDLYNRRGDDPELKRLTFCLLGVASPGDLIQNKDVTPFNIGRRIELQDFTEQEMLKLAAGITHVDQEQARKLIHRVYYWTGGQPYLTQKLCQGVAHDTSILTAQDLDQLVARLFLNQHSTETESHFIFIRERLLAQRRLDPTGFQRTLDLYGKILKGRSVRDSEVSEEVTRLKLSGLVRGENGVLVVKNPIYRQNFGTSWVRAQLHKQLDWKLVINYAGAAFRYSLPIFFVCILFAYIAQEVDIKSERAKVSNEFANLYSAKISQAWNSEYRNVNAAFYEKQVTDGQDLGVKVDLAKLKPKPPAHDVDPSRLYESRFLPAGTFDLGWGKTVDHAEMVPMNFSDSSEVGLLIASRSKGDPNARDGDLHFSFWNAVPDATERKNPTRPLESTNVTAFAFCTHSRLIAVNYFNGTNKLKLVQVGNLKDLNAALKNDNGTVSLDPPQPRSNTPGNQASTITRVSKLGFSRDGHYLALGFDSGEVALLTISNDAKGPKTELDLANDLQRNWWTDLKSDQGIDSLAFLGGGSILLAGNPEKVWSFDGSGGRDSSLMGPVAISPDDWSHVLNDTSTDDAFFLRADSTSINSYSNSTLLDNTRLRLGSPPTAFAFSPNGTVFVMGLTDGSICLGDNSGVEETIPAFSDSTAPAPTSSDKVMAIAFSPDGKRIIAVDQTGMTRVFSLLDQPAPVIAVGEKLSDAESLWQLDYNESLLEFVPKPQANADWKKVRFDPIIADDYDRFWCFADYIDSLMDSLATDLHDTNVQGKVTESLNDAIQAGDALHLDNAQQDPRRNPFFLDQELAGYLKSKNAPTLTDLQNLPEAQRWLVLGLRMDDWKTTLSPQDLEAFQLEYARVIGDRCQALTNFWEKSKIRPSDVAPREQQLSMAVDLVQTAFNSGLKAKAAYSNLPDVLTNDPRLKPTFSKLTELDQLATHLDDELNSALDGTKDTRSAALAHFEQFIAEQGPVTFGIMLRAAVNYNLGAQYAQAESCYNRADQLAGSDDSERALSLYEHSFLAQHTTDGPQAALNFARQATLANPNSRDYWERRINLEIRAAPVSGIYTFVDLQGAFKKAVDDREKVLRNPDPASTCLPLLHLQLGGIYAAVENFDAARGEYNLGLAPKPSLRDYQDFWKNRPNQNEVEENWCLDKINDGIETNKAAMKNHALSDDDKQILLWLYSKRAYYNCLSYRLRAGIDDFNFVLSNTPSDDVKGNALLRLAVGLSFLGLNEEAEKAFKSGSRLASDYADNDYDHYTYGKFLECAGKLKLATPEYQKAYQPAQSITSYRFLPLLAMNLSLTGNEAEALSLIDKASASKATQDDRIFILQAQAYVLRWQEQHLSAPEEVKKSHDSAQAAMAAAQDLMKQQESPPHLDLADAAVFLGDIATARAEDRLYRLAFPSDRKESLILEARIEMADTSQPGGTDRALVKLARLARMEYYTFSYLALGDVDTEKFSSLPGYAELETAAKVSGPNDLGPRDLRLAEWMEKLPVTDPDAKKDIMESAQACRDLAKQYTDAPINIPPLP